MNIIIIDERDDDYCYELAYKIYKELENDVFKDIFKALKIE
jgi:hypothetical protein